jgi:hypothetical protein
MLSIADAVRQDPRFTRRVSTDSLSEWYRTRISKTDEFVPDPPPTSQEKEKEALRQDQIGRTKASIQAFVAETFMSDRQNDVLQRLLGRFTPDYPNVPPYDTAPDTDILIQRSLVSIAQMAATITAKENLTPIETETLRLTRAEYSAITSLAQSQTLGRRHSLRTAAEIYEQVYSSQHPGAAIEGLSLDTAIDGSIEPLKIIESLFVKLTAIIHKVREISQQA